MRATACGTIALAARKNEESPVRHATPGQCSADRETSGRSEREVEGPGCVPAVAFVALAHPASRERQLAGANHEACHVPADAELIGAVVAEATHFRPEEHPLAPEIVAKAADRIIGVKSRRI